MGTLSFCLLLILSLKISLTLQRNNIQSLDHKKVNMVKTAKEKTIHKAMRSADKFYTEIPAFADVFDEETWYQFCFVFVACTIVCVFLLSRYIDIRSLDPLDRDHKGLKIKKKQYTKSSSPEEQKCFFKEE